MKVLRVFWKSSAAIMSRKERIEIGLKWFFGRRKLGEVVESVVGFHRTIEWEHEFVRFWHQGRV